jgi:CheY-like chemotaxis protein
VDPDRIQQVVWNLVNNAVKFTPNGGRVALALRRLNDHVTIEVTDTGEGMSAAFLPHLFERFRQADASTTRAHGGLGLGLAITRQLVELHGGTIRAHSAGEGKGSTFTVELPLGSLATESEPGSRPSSAGLRPAPFKPAPVLDGTRVLLVEDEAPTRVAVQWTLEQCKAEVTAVDSVSLALAAFRDALRGRRFDVVVSDIGMPIQDGYELIREIRRIERQRGETRPTPAAALTAYASEDDRARARAAGFQSHVPKPVEPEVLVEAVAALAGRDDPEQAADPASPQRTGDEA